MRSDLQDLVELAEAFADGKVSDRERAKAFGPLKASKGFDAGAVRDCLEKSITKYPALIGESVGHRLAEEMDEAGAEARLADLYREIFPAPSRAKPLKKAWLTAESRQLAEQMYADRSFDQMPKLGKLLKVAGCDDAKVLEHCRSKGPHFRGCWVVDQVLGNQ